MIRTRINNGYLLFFCEYHIHCILSSSVMKTSVFSRVQSTSENLNVFITRDEFFL